MSGISEQTEFETDLRPISKKPSYIAYQISKSKDGEKTFWTKIGVGFLHKDAGGLNVILDCLPADGRVTLRARPRSDESN